MLVPGVGRCEDSVSRASTAHRLPTPLPLARVDLAGSPRRGVFGRMRTVLQMPPSFLTYHWNWHGNDSDKNSFRVVFWVYVVLPFFLTQIVVPFLPWCLSRSNAEFWGNTVRQFAFVSISLTIMSAFLSSLVCTYYDEVRSRDVCRVKI